MLFLPMKPKCINLFINIQLDVTQYFLYPPLWSLLKISPFPANRILPLFILRLCSLPSPDTPAPPECLPWMQASKVTLDGRSGGKWSPRNWSEPIYVSHPSIGSKIWMKLPWSRHPRLPRILESKANMLPPLPPQKLVVNGYAYRHESQWRRNSLQYPGMLSVGILSVKYP